MPFTPQALPTIFWARVKPFEDSSLLPGLLNRSEGSKFRAALVLSVNCLPIINGILPLALTSSRSTSVLRSNLVITSLVFASTTSPAKGFKIIS